MSSLSVVFAGPTIGWPEVLLRLFVAAALGGAIGFERELREREAGLRTHTLVSVGSALFTIAGAYGFRDSVAAVSVGVVEGVPLLDLDYAEDSNADTDMNVVMTGDGRLVEVQATAERDPFARETLDELIELATAGIAEVAALQAEAVARELP